MNFLREYFIGDYLRSESDVLKQASIRLVFNVVALSVASMVLFFFVYLARGFHYQFIKTIVILIIFSSALFYIRATHSITLICHVLLLVSWANNNINIYLFDDFNFFVALLTILNILFAFHVLGSRAGIFYAIIHFIPILVHQVGKNSGYQMGKAEPQQLAFMEATITFCVVFFIITYLIYHYHQAYEVAKENLHTSVEELRTAKELAEEMNRLKTNFLSNMSHEIRTPINGILGISQVIEMETDNPEIKNYVQLQQQSGRRLLSTITSILDLARIEAEQKQLKLNVIDVNVLLRECIAPLETLAKNKRLQFSFSASREQLFCLSDENMLYQVVYNVVGNAIKFTDKGRVEVSTTRMKDKIFIKVKDTGIGISEEFLPRIFNSFEQESSGRSRNYEGTGLGLSISKRYIELLGGEIRVQSAKDEGSVFEIVLPAYKML
ncbi:sensor histidine kinase [Chryseolinea lacunae]|uniref:histidine kinase n=1 Tax=Chryseolinea lacunae TaxID=2801331 RepID=A0ABS1KQ77_9BACT|nr:HAMP domain-containing sensor histidine kinase [Chryseolinea lacunae]MBL0741633.1 HAMP domain-containing histidine kinase [Chryseolinea lacunae]